MKHNRDNQSKCTQVSSSVLGNEKVVSRKAAGLPNVDGDMFKNR